MAFECAFTVEGRTDEELPEVGLSYVYMFVCSGIGWSVGLSASGDGGAPPLLPPSTNPSLNQYTRAHVYKLDRW